MERIQIAPQGPTFSALIQGYWRLCDWNMTPQERLTFIKKHLELGITTVDHADIYGNYQCESLFGQALALEPSIRSQLEIVTKCDIHLCTQETSKHSINYYNTSSAYIKNSIETSLKNLQTQQLDVVLIHRPDALMCADEVAQTFELLLESGKVKHFGVSNFSARQFELLQSRLSKPLVTNQVEINPLCFDAIENGSLDLLQQLRVRPMAWSCLAGGRVFHEKSEQGIRLRQILKEIAIETGASQIEQVIYAWVRRLPCHPLPIIGSGKIERVKQAVDALQIQLTREQWYRIWVASKGHAVP